MVTVSIAAMVEREEALKETIKSLINQVDKINVFLHGYIEIPDFLKHDKIFINIDMDGIDRGDLDKFNFDVLEGYTLYCDDDLIYPRNYVKEMIKAIDQYDCKAIISFCGNIPLEPPIGNYYDDRVTSSLFSDQKKDHIAVIPGTGVMGYHTDLIQKIDFLEQPKNMADIHMGIFARKQGIPVIIRKHKGTWIKHSKKVDLNKTIFGEMYRKNDWIQTDLINDNFSVPKILHDEVVKVTVVIANIRQKTNPEYISECLQSVKEQSYPNIEIKLIRNYEKLYTIGYCWNRAIETAKGDWILFVGDDDFISNDYVASLVSTIQKHPDAIQISSFLTMVGVREGKVMNQKKDLIPTGMWNKQWLIDNPCNEHVVKWCDTDMMDRANKNKRVIMDWQHGYYYRSHGGQVSGEKILG
uniref:Putative glycosyltransferase n=1 Tax=viral metagenome TaxID=1070528 RepID=A0A6M3XVF7_9ZZZZ